MVNRTIYNYHNRNEVTRFFIDKDKRTVVCIMTVENEIPRRLEKYNLCDNNYTGARDVRKYRGVAKCAEDDEWDTEYGMHLAEYRAMIARRADVNKELKEFTRSVRKDLDNLDKYGLIKRPRKPIR